MPETWLSEDTMFWNNSISKSGGKHMHSISTFIYHLQMCPKKLWIGSTCTPMCTEIHMHINSYMHLLWFFSDFIMIHFFCVKFSLATLIWASQQCQEIHLLISSFCLYSPSVKHQLGMWHYRVAIFKSFPSDMHTNEDRHLKCWAQGLTHNFPEWSRFPYPFSLPFLFGEMIDFPCLTKFFLKNSCFVISLW